MSVNCADLSVTSMCYDELKVNNLEYTTSCTQWTPIGAAAVRENSLFYEVCFPANCKGTYWANEFCCWFRENLGYGAYCNVSMVRNDGLYEWTIEYNTNHNDICIYTPINAIFWNSNREQICFLQDTLVIDGSRSRKDTNSILIDTNACFNGVLEFTIPKRD